jgi:hypothetical protein
MSLQQVRDASISGLGVDPDDCLLLILRGGSGTRMWPDEDSSFGLSRTNFMPASVRRGLGRIKVLKTCSFIKLS